MFERKEPFQWKIPILILTGILVLSGGIYIGVKTRKVEEKPAFNNETINEKNEETKDSFGLSENCEIWLYKRSEEGSLIDSEPNMIGFAPKELLDKTGGVVQGMSGSPIIQNGKIIGAVTHVIIDNPTTGYGLFITTMLEEGEK